MSKRELFAFFAPFRASAGEAAASAPSRATSRHAASTIAGIARGTEGSRSGRIPPVDRSRETCPGPSKAQLGPNVQPPQSNVQTDEISAWTCVRGSVSAWYVGGREGPGHRRGRGLWVAGLGGRPGGGGRGGGGMAKIYRPAG